MNRSNVVVTVERMAREYRITTLLEDSSTQVRSHIIGDTPRLDYLFAIAQHWLEIRTTNPDPHLSAMVITLTRIPLPDGGWSNRFDEFSISMYGPGLDPSRALGHIHSNNAIVLRVNSLLHTILKSL